MIAGVAVALYFSGYIAQVFDMPSMKVSVETKWSLTAYDGRQEAIESPPSLVTVPRSRKPRPFG